MAQKLYAVFGSSEKLPRQPAPALAAHKWIAFDRFKNAWDEKGNELQAFETKMAKLAFYGEIQNEVFKNYRIWYREWYQRFREACQSIGAELCWTFSTEWRLVVGWSGNPAYETGLTLHHLHGFPIIPGSAVKGLLHHVAEMGLLEFTADLPAMPQISEDRLQDPPETLLLLLSEAEFIKALFGSLSVETPPNPKAKVQSDSQSKPIADPRNGQETKTPLELLRDWKAASADRSEGSRIWQSCHARLKALCNSHTGGMLRCMDAVPSPTTPGAKGELLQIDILNPHYSEYYKDSASNVPKDSEGPKPVLFLAVAPGVSFEFRFGLASWPTNKQRADDDPEKDRLAALRDHDPDDVAERLKEWLTKGLQEWGLGAKTAAGYGYMQPQSCAARDVQANSPSPAEVSPEARAATLLPDGLGAGELPNALARVMAEPEDVQIAGAHRLRRLYPKQIKNWRSKAGKRPSVRSRLDWLDSLAP